ncbi:MAG: hypothetical protein ACK55F_25570 [Acidobacteriota bacterium]
MNALALGWGAAAQWIGGIVRSTSAVGAGPKRPVGFGGGPLPGETRAARVEAWNRSSATPPGEGLGHWKKTSKMANSYRDVFSVEMNSILSAMKKESHNEVKLKDQPKSNR